MPPAHCTNGSRINAQTSPAMRVQQTGERIGGALGALLGGGCGGRTERIGRRREQDVHHQRRVHAAIQRNVADRQRADGFAVIAIVQRDEFRTLRCVAAIAVPVEGHLQCDFHAGRTVVGIEDFGERRAIGLTRRKREQALGQFHRGRMREPGQDHLFQRMRLPRDGLGDSRLSVPMQIRPPTADAIQGASAVVTDQPCALAAGHREQGQGMRMFAHLRAWVPQHSEVARPPVVGVVYHLGMHLLHIRIIARRTIARRARAGAA